MHYDELIKKRDLIYGNGPAGYFIKTFRRVGKDEGLLLAEISRIDFGQRHLSLRKKAKLIKKAVERSSYSSFMPELFGVLLGIYGISGFWKGGEPQLAACICLILSLIVIAIYCGVRIKYETSREALIACLDHILACQKTKQYEDRRLSKN